MDYLITISQRHETSQLAVIFERLLLLRGNCFQASAVALNGRR